MKTRHTIPPKSSIELRATSQRTGAPRIARMNARAASASIAQPAPARPFDLLADIRHELEDLSWGHLMFCLNAVDRVD